MLTEVEYARRGYVLEREERGPLDFPVGRTPDRFEFSNGMEAEDELSQNVEGTSPGGSVGMVSDEADALHERIGGREGPDDTAR